MAETTKIELVTPKRVMVEKSVEMVVFPGVEGLFGVLPRHAPLLAGLKRGVVELYEGGKVSDRYLIDGGFADVSGESVKILAERALILDSAEKGALKIQAAEATGDEADFLNAAISAL